MHSEVNFIRAPVRTDNPDSGALRASLAVSLVWRQRPLRLQLQRHDIIAAGGTVEWFQDQNVTEVERLEDAAVFYQGYVIGANYSYVALERRDGFVRKNTLMMRF